MRILAIDTALPAVAVCVMDAGSSVALVRDSAAMAKGHAEALMPMVARLMAKVEGGFGSIDRVAVTVGPGSFTGIRVGVAAARGIALARGVDAVGVSTLAAFATPLLSQPSTGIVAAAIDARHGHIYFTAYGPEGRVLTSPRVLSLRDACRLLGAGRIRVAGSAALLLRDEASLLGAEVTVVDSSPAPDIVSVARLGLIADPINAPARPIYLKPPDVKPNLRQTIPHAVA